MLTIRKQLIGTLLLLGLIPLALFLTLISASMKRSLLITKHAEMRHFGNEIKRQIASNLSFFVQRLESISNNTILKDSIKPELKIVEFEKIKMVSPFFSSLNFLNTDGEEIKSPEGLNILPRDVSDQLKECVLLRRMIFSDPEIDRSRQLMEDKPLMLMRAYQPVLDKNQEVLFVVRAVMNFEQIWDILKNAKMGETGTFVLVDDFGNALYHPDSEQILTNYFKHTGIDFNKVDSGEYNSSKGETLIFEMQRFTQEETHTDRAWSLISRMEKSDAMALASQNEQTSIWLGLFTLSMTAFVGTCLASRIARPIANASKAARAVADGNLDIKLKAEGPWEMRRLAEIFNQMTNRVLRHNEEMEMKVESRTRILRESQDCLAEMTAQLRSAYESTKEGILVINKDGQVVTANRRVEDIFELSAQDIHGSSLAEFKHLLCHCFKHPAAFDACWESHHADSHKNSESEWDLCAPLKKSVSIYTAPVTNQEGESIARLWMFRDITEQKQLEEQQRLASVERESLWKNISFAAAHKMGNPIFAIEASALSLEKRIAEGKMGEALQILARIRRSLDKAQEIVAQFKSLAREPRTRSEPVLLLPLLRQSCQRAVDYGVKCEINCSENLKIYGDGMRLAECFDELIGNSLNWFDKDTKVISIYADLTEMAGTIPGSTKHVIVIKYCDNGPGIEDDRKPEIFLAFSTTSTHGIGLGLAIVRRIIEDHGGTIIESGTVSLGAKFVIELPLEKSPNPNKDEQNINS